MSFYFLVPGSAALSSVFLNVPTKWLCCTSVVNVPLVHFFCVPRSLCISLYSLYFKMYLIMQNSSVTLPHIPRCYCVAVFMCTTQSLAKLGYLKCRGNYRGDRESLRPREGHTQDGAPGIPPATQEVRVWERKGQMWSRHKKKTT